MTSTELYTALSRELTQLLDKYDTEAKQLPVGEQFTYRLYMQELTQVLAKINRRKGDDEDAS